MQDDTVIELDIAPGDAAGIAPDAEEVTTETTSRLPDVSGWLPGGRIWLYAVPVILLLFLWLFYPVILVLVGIILLLWWLG